MAGTNSGERGDNFWQKRVQPPKMAIEPKKVARDLKYQIWEVDEMFCTMFVAKTKVLISRRLPRS